MSLLIPRRRRGVEFLDRDDVPPSVRVRSHRDIALSNAMLGGHRALRAAVLDASAGLPRECVVLDVGAGTGTVLRLARGVLATRGIRCRCIELDIDPGLVASAASRGHEGVCACATALPFADRSVDVVLCCLLLHHFTGDAVGRVLGELSRVARHRVIVCDLRRSWAAAAGFWAASYPLAFHPVSRHDGLVSILRGFTRHELLSAVRDATGVVPEVRRRLGFRLVASWSPAPDA